MRLAPAQGKPVWSMKRVASTSYRIVDGRPFGRGPQKLRPGITNGSVEPFVLQTKANRRGADIDHNFGTQRFSPRSRRALSRRNDSPQRRPAPNQETKHSLIPGKFSFRHDSKRAALDEVHSAEHLPAGNRLVAIGEAIAARNYRVYLLFNYSMNHKATAAGVEQQLAGLDLYGFSATDQQDIAGPNRWDHTDARDSQPESSGRPQNLSGEITLKAGLWGNNRTILSSGRGAKIGCVEKTVGGGRTSARSCVRSAA